MMRKFGYIAAFLLAAACLVGCQDRLRFHSASIEREANPVQIERFDHDFYTLDSAALAQKYGEFLPIYVHQIMQIAPGRIEDFKADSAFAALRAQVDSVYTSDAAMAQTLGVAFAYYQHYFPQNAVPRVSFHVSGFNQSVVTTPGRVSASIDNYLGATFPTYAQVAYQYELPFMTPRHLPIDLMLGWLTTEYPDTNGRLLESMVYHGKLMYLLQVFFPDEEMAELLSYTPQQLDWCKRYEANIWAMIVEKRELYATDWRTITRYTQPAPFTNGLSQEHSPGRVGVFIGWRIVSAYMERNKQVTLVDLMAEKDAQKILQLSGYRP
jgi:hypothetical protein